LAIQSCKQLSNLLQVFVGKYVDSRVKFERDPCYEAMLWVFSHFHVSSSFKQNVDHFIQHRSSTQNRRLVRTAQVRKAINRIFVLVFDCVKLQNMKNFHEKAGSTLCVHVPLTHPETIPTPNSQPLTLTQISGGRLRLRSRLATLSAIHASSVNLFNDTFASWCVRVRLPLSTGPFLKKKLYFLRAQNYDISNIVCDLVSKDVAKLIVETPIHDPDTDVIDLVISRLLLNTKPFPELVEFGVQVLPVGSASSTVRSMPNPLLFQLYVAAHQPTNWKEHWKLLYPELTVNNLVMNNVERFVASHPVCIESVIPYVLAAVNNCMVA
jgi:hypothetical protein